MKKTIRDFNLNNKKVIIRVDFNVPIKDGKITDDNRIIESLPTIKYALDNGAKIILMSHLGRIKTEEDLNKNSLKIVSERLGELLNKKIIFINSTRSVELETVINNMKQEDIVLMENTRFEDLNGSLESKCDPELSKYWASLGDIFINDAFGTSHRSHASNVGIASNLPSGIGFLVEKEVNMLGSAITNPKRPFTVILGGAKVSDKIKVIENLCNIADNVLIGGAMAFTFLKSQGINVGSSYVDEESIELASQLIEKYSNKIILPIDVIVSKKIGEEAKELFISDINSDDICLDIGNKTVEVFKEYLDSSKCILWNGPLGYVECDKYVGGTKSVCEILKNTNADKLIGGGDSAAIVIDLGYKDYMTHISTGGGASLEFMEGKQLPGIAVIDNYEK